MAVPAASPSIPSVRLTALVVLRIITTTRRVEFPQLQPDLREDGHRRGVPRLKEQGGKSPASRSCPRILFRAFKPRERPRDTLV